MKYIVFLLIFNCLYAQKTFKIAFGSCASEQNPLIILDSVVNHHPDLFVFLGDNIYGDTQDMKVLKSKYDLLKNKASFQNLKKNVKMIATWDDHDFGQNDAGKNYPMKTESKKLFLDFFEEPLNSQRRKQEGIYCSYFYEAYGKKIQVILLDTRTFRSDLKMYNKEMASDKRYFYPLDYAPWDNSDSTLLGDSQWKWLESEFLKKADIRIIGSSTQFGIEFNGYESWANFPHEQQKMLSLIKKTKANGVIFISGDVHYAEISKLKTDGLYPIYDVTSSGLSSTWLFATPNKNRIEGPIMENHFGLLTFNFDNQTQIIMEIWDVKGNQRVEYQISLDEISFK